MSSQTPSERDRDKVLKDTFPASDPPANSGITGPEETDKRPAQGDVSAQPTGTPTSDRHATETAHQTESEKQPTPKP